MRSAFLALSALAASAVALPTFPTDWQALVSQAIVLNQGGTVNPDGSICCDAMSPECKVQTAFEEGMQYFAVTLNKTAYKNPDNSGIVTDFNAGKEYEVNATGDCQSFCPLGSQEDELFPLSIDPNSTLIGTVACGSNMCQEWQHRLAIPILNITMEVSDFTVIPGTPATPVAFTQHIEPLNDPIGDENQTFTQFQSMDGKTFPANAFTVNGAASCPMSNQCQGDDDNASNDNNFPPMLLDSLFVRVGGIRRPGQTHRSQMIAQSVAAYRARASAKATHLPEYLESRLAQVPASMRFAARRALLAKLESSEA